MMPASVIDALAGNHGPHLGLVTIEWQANA